MIACGQVLEYARSLGAGPVGYLSENQISRKVTAELATFPLQ